VTEIAGREAAHRQSTIVLSATLALGFVAPTSAGPPSPRVLRSIARSSDTSIFGHRQH
jgi:hypothetical protein